MKRLSNDFNGSTLDIRKIRKEDCESGQSKDPRGNVIDAECDLQGICNEAKDPVRYMFAGMKQGEFTRYVFACTLGALRKTQ